MLVLLMAQISFLLPLVIDLFSAAGGGCDVAASTRSLDVPLVFSVRGILHWEITVLIEHPAAPAATARLVVVMDEFAKRQLYISSFCANT